MGFMAAKKNMNQSGNLYERMLLSDASVMIRHLVGNIGPNFLFSFFSSITIISCGATRASFAINS